MKKRIQKGFTMIELIIVIAILGILAAFALPRFANFVPAAQTSTRDGIVSSLNSAIGIAHAQWVANGQTGTVTLDGSASPITMNAQGYPDVGTTYNSATTCQTLLNALLSNVSSDISAGFTTPNCTVTSANFGSGTGAVITLTPTNAS